MTDASIELDQATRSRLREDGQILRRTANRLAMPSLLRRIAMLVIGLVVFWIVAGLILRAGAAADYTRLGPPDAAAVAFLTRINMYIWWAVVAVLALITFFSLKSAWSSGVYRENAVVVPADALQGVSRQVSPPTLAVMRWVWADHSEPFSIGDLRRAIQELRSGRVDKMKLVREQQVMLRAQLPLWNPRGGLNHGTAQPHEGDAEPSGNGRWATKAAVGSPAAAPAAGRERKRDEPFLAAGPAPAGPASP